MINNRVAIANVFSAVLVVTLLAACNDNVTKELITFKNVPIGKEGAVNALRKICMEVEFNTSIYGDKCSLKEKNNSIFFRVNYGALGEQNARVSLAGDELIEVEIKAGTNEMVSLTNALVDKYGKPKRTKYQVNNTSNTQSFEKEVFVWIDAQGSRITVESIYDSITEGRLLIESAEWIAMHETLKMKEREDTKSNL